MNESNKISNNKDSWLLASIPVVMMILKPYAISSGSGIFICDVLVILLFSYFLTKRRVKFYMPLFLLMCVEIILTLISSLTTLSFHTDIVLAIKIAIVFLLYLLVYSTIWSTIDPQKFFKIAEAIGLICAILAILQFVFSSLGFDFYDGKLPLPMGENSYFGGLFDSNTHDLRVHSFFEEPSYLAFFEIPLVVHFVQENKYLKAIICALACILSGAMTGLLGLIISILLMVLCDKEIEKKYKWYLIGIIFSVGIVIIILYNSNASLKTLFDYYFRRRTMLEASMKRADSSFSQRIIGNSMLFTQYNLINRIIGVGFNQYVLYFGLVKDYSNDIVSTLLNFGYIGIVTLITAIIAIFKNTTSHGRIMLVIFIILLSVDHSWFGPVFFYVLTWTIMKSDSIDDKANMFLKVRY